MRPRWSIADDATLRASYLAGGIYAACAAIPHRSTTGIYARAARLGLTRRRRWTAADNALLRRLWDGEQTLQEIAAALKRTPLTTYYHARNIGLPVTCPEGWETLTAAALRTGYGDCSTLRTVLRWAGVQIRRALVRPMEHAGKRVIRRWIVWPADVDAAIESWHQTETVNRAAERVGVSQETLSRWLEDAGVQKPRRKKAHWRVTAEDVQRAVGSREKAA